MTDHAFIWDVPGAAPRFTSIVGLMQGAAAIGASSLLVLFGKIRVDLIKNTKKADFLKKFC